MPINTNSCTAPPRHMKADSYPSQFEPLPPEWFAGVTPEVSDVTDHLGYWLQRVARLISARLEDQMAQRHITEPEWLVLRALLNQPGLSRHSLTWLLGTTRAATWKIVKRLEERGLLYSGLAPGRARMQGLTLTPQGEALVPELAALADDNDFYFFCHLSAAARARLKYSLWELDARFQFGFRRRRR